MEGLWSLSSSDEERRKESWDDDARCVKERSTRPARMHKSSVCASASKGG